MAFHQMIKERRKQLGMTQEELAKELNVSRSAISNWEIGRNYPDITTLIELAQMYQVSLDELFYDDIDLVNKFAEDNKKKEQLKKVNKLLVFLLLIGVSSTIYLFLTRKPEIVFAHPSTLDRRSHRFLRPAHPSSHNSRTTNMRHEPSALRQCSPKRIRDGWDNPD